MILVVIVLIILGGLLVFRITYKSDSLENKRNLRYLALVALGGVCLPFLIHCIASSNFSEDIYSLLGVSEENRREMPENAYNTWVLFFGSFSGSIIGVMGAWATARYNIERQNQIQKEHQDIQISQYQQQLELQYSSYVGVEDMVGQIDLFNWGETGAMEEYRILNSSEYTKRRQLVYQQIIRRSIEMCLEQETVEERDIFVTIDRHLKDYSTMWYQKICNYGPNVVYDFYIEIDYQLTACLDRVNLFSRFITFSAYLEGLPVKENMIIPLKSFLEEEEKAMLSEAVPHNGEKEKEEILEELLRCDVYVTGKRMIYKELSGKCIEVNYTADSQQDGNQLRKTMKEIELEAFEEEIATKRKGITWAVVNQSILSNRKKELYYDILMGINSIKQGRQSQKG